MMRLFYSLFGILLMSTQCYGFVVVSSKALAPTGTPTIIESYESGTSARYLDAYTLGQGPHDLGGYPLYSISIKTGTTTATGTVTCRAGTQLDLTSGYTEEFSTTFSGVGGDWIEVPSVTQPTGITHWACDSDVAISATYSASDNHAGSSYIWDSYPDWVLEANTGRDMNFRIKVLQ